MSYTHGHTRSSTVLSGAQMLRPSLYTHKHIATHISEYGSTIHVQMACISCFLSAYNHALDQKRKTAAKHAYKARDV